MMIALIAAVARHQIIGNAGKLPWHLPEDLRWFRRHTLGHTLLMGRRTFEAVGAPLPGRRTIVLSRRQNDTAPGCLTAPDIPSALAAASGASRLFVCGGADIYRQTLDLAERIYLTRLDIEVAGDARFPDFDEECFDIIFQERHTLPFHFQFTVLQRRTTDKLKQKDFSL